MNTKLPIYLAALLLLICGCELGTDRVYMEMYEVMNVNSTTIENSIKSEISSMEETVKRKPEYKALVPAAHHIEALTSDLIHFINDLNKRLDKRAIKTTNSDEIKDRIVAHRQKIIESLEVLSSNRTFGIRSKEIQNITELHFFPNGTLPAINGKAFDKYSFENQSIASNKAMLAKQKNDATRLTKIAIDYLSGKIGSTIIGCGFVPVVVSVPKKNFLIKGETFETEIFLYYPHNTHHSKIEMIIKVDNKEIPMQNGVATYKTQPIIYGEHTYDVVISVKNPFNNKFERYRRTFSFEVGERCY